MSIHPVRVLCTLLLATGFTFLIVAQEDDGKGEKASELTAEQREAITEYFHASSESFDGGKLTLVYDFEKMTDALAEDWGPSLDKGKGRVRWTRAGEGSHEGISGILIAQYGRWVHKAIWDSTVEVSIEVMPMSSSRKGDVIAAVFQNPKGTKIVGTNGGTQIIRMKGVKVALAFPKSPPTFSYNQRQRFRYRVADGVLTAVVQSSPRVDTAKKKSFMKKLDKGRVGVAWNGQVNGIISKITIHGQLDVDWVKKITGK